MGGLGAGLTLAAIVLVGYGLTGGAANPARWFGPAVAELSVYSLESDAFRDHTVYWLGPIAGALLAGAVYDFLILRTAAETEPEPDEQTLSGKSENITPKASRRVL